MRLLSLFTAVLVGALSLTACDSIIDDTLDPISTVGDAELTDPEQMEFVINGVQARSNNVQDNMSVQAGLMSDQFIFGGGIGGGATFPTFRDLMRGLPSDTNPLNNNSVDGTQNHLGQYRFLADDLLRRLNEIGADAFEEGEDDPLWIQGNYKANFHGGVARYYWATYFGLEPGINSPGGGVISELENPADTERGEFIASADMYDRALSKLNDALPFADAYQTRVINTIKARIALFQDDLAEAEARAQEGLAPGDAPFQNIYRDGSGNQQNTWFSQGGPGRTQAVAAPRFFHGAEYLDGDLESPESVRIPQFDGEDAGQVIDGGATLLNRDGEHPLRVDIGFGDGDSVPLYAQGLYTNRGDNIDFATWQENHLMLAEINQRNGDDALALEQVNEVRASHGLADIDAADYDGMNTIYVERDKELFTMSLRLPDQRRATLFNIDGLDIDRHGWHLADNVWAHLPITLAERLNNPNLPNELP